MKEYRAHCKLLPGLGADGVGTSNKRSLPFLQKNSALQRIGASHVPWGTDIARENISFIIYMWEIMEKSN